MSEKQKLSKRLDFAIVQVRSDKQWWKLLSEVDALESKLNQINNLLNKDDLWILHNCENWLIILRKVMVND